MLAAHKMERGVSMRNLLAKSLVILCLGVGSLYATPHSQSVAPPEQSTENLSRQALAKCLKIDIQVLEAHPNFEAFVLKNGVHRDMFYHGHRVLVSDDGMPSLVYRGEQLAWSDFQEIVDVDEAGAVLEHFYTYEGFVPGRRDESLPIFELTERHGDRYVLELVTNWTAQGLLVRPAHAWMRLVDNKGGITSFGFYGECLLSGASEFVRLLTPHPGYIHSPDYCEVWYMPYETLTIPIELSEEQYHAVREYVAEMQRDHSYTYQLFGGHGGANCAGFLNHILEFLGIENEGTYFVFPSHIAAWQKQVKEWRRKELAQLRSGTDYTTEDEDAIKYGLPGAKV